jgi:3',5'-cyclic AMP phosphodiesterase CpdA
MKLKKVSILRLAITLSLFLGVFSIYAETPVLKFNKNKEFKIVQFTDVHWENSTENISDTLKVMDTVLEKEKPDLVVLTGDLVLTKKQKDDWNILAKPMMDRHIPWAAVLGNHDLDHERTHSNLTAEELVTVIQELPFSVTKTGPEEFGSSGSYLLPIQSSESNKTEAVIYMLYSNRDGQDKDIKSDGWITPKQIDWYKEQSSRFTQSNNNTPLPSLMFFHIPLPEYSELWNNGKIIGMKGEKECGPKINTGMFAAVLLQKDVMGIFTGHDHVNDYIGSLYGVYLGYGRKTGKDAYGNIKCGARVFVLHENKQTFNTWIRLEDGKILYNLSLPADL